MKDENNPQPVVGEVLKTGPWAKNWRIAETLADMERKASLEGRSSLSVWGRWPELWNFPKDKSSTPTDRYVFIDQYLARVLQAERDPLHYGRVRPDMNGAGGSKRAWLLHKTLLQLVMPARAGHDGQHVFPEDLPKTVEDIYLLHKHHGNLEGPARTLQHYKSTEDLRAAMTPWHSKKPISASEREAANREFLAENGGNGEAIRIATLSNGTEVIQVQSEAASRAYGSPDWCTAYRNRDTYFKDHKDDLLIIINPQGERWQFHFRTGQFNDANDNLIARLPAFLSEHEGLARICGPFLARALTGAALEDSAEHFDKVVAAAQKNTEWHEVLAQPVGMAAALTAAAQAGKSCVSNILNAAIGDEKWSDALVEPTGIPNALDAAAKAQQWTSVSKILLVASYDDKFVLAIPGNEIPNWLNAAGTSGDGEAVAGILTAAKANDQWREVVTVKDIPIWFTATEGAGKWQGIACMLNAMKDEDKWREAVPVKSIPKWLNAPASTGDWYKFADLFAAVSAENKYSDAVPIDKIPVFLLSAVSSPSSAPIREIVNSARSNEKWRDALAEPEGILAALSGAVARSQHYFVGAILLAAREDDKWREILSQPTGVPAALTAAGEHSNYKTVNSILMLAKDTPEWHESIRNMEITSVRLAEWISKTGICAPVVVLSEKTAPNEIQPILRRVINFARNVPRWFT